MNTKLNEIKVFHELDTTRFYYVLLIGKLHYEFIGFVF